ncbi:MAG: dihydrodipicolinate synthase family protein [Oscillospiraceae bacterium]
MAFAIRGGVWPTMITPFTADNKPDFKVIPKLCEWYIQKGCAGVFAVCQSSEMAYLTKSEKTDIAKCVTDAIGGRIQVVASGHTADDKKTQFEEIEEMMKTGVDAYVLVSNRLDQKNEGEKVFTENAQEIFDRFPEVSFGIYECPMPFKRLVSTEFLKSAAHGERMVFLKDTCCDAQLIRERLQAVEGSPLKIFNANAASYFDTVQHGGAGYNGIMANLHPDLYKWSIDHRDDKPAEAKLMSDFLTLAGALELRIYPVSAKYHMNLEGIPMGLATRSADVSKLDKNAKAEIDSLFALETVLRKRLGL